MNVDLYNRTSTHHSLQAAHFTLKKIHSKVILICVLPSQNPNLHIFPWTNGHVGHFKLHTILHLKSLMNWTKVRLDLSSAKVRFMDIPLPQWAHTLCIMIFQLRCSDRVQDTGERSQEKKGEQFQSQGLCKVRLWEKTELDVSQRVLYQITSTAKKTR